MRDQHITTLIEAKPVSQLSDDELAIIESHTAACNACRRAYQAARIAASLIEARSAERHEVSPFFKTRVMAAIRDQRLSPELPAWQRLWQAAGTLVLTLTTLVVVLIGLTVFNDLPAASPSPEAITSQNIYSPDEVVLGRDDSADEVIGYDQVLGTMYDAEEGDGN